MKQLILTLTLILFLPTKVSAQEEVVDIVTYRLPEGSLFDIEGEEYNCFNLGEFRELLRIDADLHDALIDLDLYEQTFREQERVITQLGLAHEAASRQVDELTRERDRARLMWEDENRRRHEAENIPDVESILGWALAGVSTVAAVVLGIVLAIVVE